MKFKAGESGNPHGRPPKKKTINKRVETLIEKNLDVIETAMENATTSERIGIVINLSKII